MVTHNFDTEEPMDWPKVGERITFVEFVLVVHNELWQTACDEAIIDMDGKDGGVVVSVG